MRLFLWISFLFLAACKNQLEESKVEQREHGLSYLKGTQTLVEGEVVRLANGKVTNSHQYKAGKKLGPFFQYGPAGSISSQGFGIEIKNYEPLLNRQDLSYCILSIVQVTNGFNYATLYMDNKYLFNDEEKLVRLSRQIFADYAEKYAINDLLIFDKQHEYAITRKAVTGPNYTIDTVENKAVLRLRFQQEK